MREIRARPDGPLLTDPGHNPRRFFTFYRLPRSPRGGHIHRWQYDTVEFEVTQTFVESVWPTPTQQEAAYASGRLRGSARRKRYCQDVYPSVEESNAR